MPGRIVPPSGGVAIEPSSNTKKTFMPPSSSTQLALDGVEEHDLVAAVARRLGLGEQAGGIVAAALGGAGAARRGARVVLARPRPRPRRRADLK